MLVQACLGGKQSSLMLLEIKNMSMEHEVNAAFDKMILLTNLSPALMSSPALKNLLTIILPIC